MTKQIYKQEILKIMCIITVSEIRLKDDLYSKMALDLKAKHLNGKRYIPYNVTKKQLMDLYTDLVNLVSDYRIA